MDLTAFKQVIEAAIPKAVEAAWDSTEALIRTDKNHSNLKEKIKTLCAVRNDLQARNAKYKSTMKQTMDNWFDRVETVEKKARGLERCFSEIKDKSAWNLGYAVPRTNLSRHMTSVCSDIDQLVMESNQLCDTLVHKVADRVLKMTAPDISYIPSQQEVLNKLLQHLPDEDYRVIRVLGMSGAGKTTILKNLNNHERVADLYKIVIWVTVSGVEDHRENLTIERLQQVIAERLLIDMESTTDTVSVAVKIKEELKGVKFLLLLDDVKAEPDLDLIGIPEGARGSKIVMTTKFRDVKLPSCYSIEVKMLSAGDSWNMCHKLLALPNDVKAKPQLERTARQALKICDGLPLMIKMAARAFKAIEKSEHSWNDVLQTFERWPENRENNIMKNLLEFCCDRLDHKQKRCFLYSALHPEDTEIPKDGLLECWAAENFLESGDDAKIVGRNVLHHLKNVMLLEEDATGIFVTMHRVIREIALIILSEDMKDKYLVRTTESLHKPKRQRVELWADKKWISLANNSVDISPDAPANSSQLTTLFVQNYSKHKQIPDSFFQYMHGLLVLNLYKTEIMTLPSSIGKLSNLKVLYLNGCKVLKELPSLIIKLKSLEVLDIRGTSVCKLPHQIKGLSRLRCLLVSLSISTFAKYDVIFKLSGVKELIIDVASEVQECTKFIEDVVEKGITLPNVITFQLCLLDEVIDVIEVVGKTVKIYMPKEHHLSRFLEQRKDLKKHYFQVFVGCFISTGIKIQDFRLYDTYLKYYNGRCHDVVFNIISAIKVEALELINHNVIEHLPSIESMFHVKSCLIESCNNMKAIVGDHGTLDRSLLQSCHNMERLDARKLPILESIWEGQMPLGSLSKLKTLVLCECPMLTIVFSSDVYNQLLELQHLEIQDCGSVTEIVKCSQGVTLSMIPKLTTLILCRMDRLSNIGFTLDLTSLSTFKIHDCPNMLEALFQ